MEAGIRFHKIHAINKAKKYQLLGNIFLYSMAVLTCIFFSSIYWFITSGFTSSKVFFLGSLPKIMSVFLSYKSIFIFGNAIVIVLIGESKFFATNHPTTSDVYYNEYINQKRSFPSSLEVKKTFEVNEYLVEKAERSCVRGQNIEEKKLFEEKKKVKKEKENFEREDEQSLSTEELNRRADDFINRVNKQRRFEARLLVC